MPRLTRAALIRKGRCRSVTGRQANDLPAAEQYAHLALRPRRHVYVPTAWADYQPTPTIATVTALPAPAVEPDEDRITCHHCGTVSPYPDDADHGMWQAHDAGWHTTGRDQCGCPQLCPNCADQCGANTSPYLTSYPGAAA